MGSNPIAPIYGNKIMNKHSNPIDFLIDFAWSAGADRFVVNNARDELKRLKEMNDFHVTCWARINSRGDIYNPSIVFNPYLDQNTVLHLYTNKTEYGEKYGKLSK